MSGTTYLAGKKQKIFIGSQKITKAFVGGKQVYSSGSLVTYNVDGSIYTEEVEEGQDVLHPSSFTPAKTNYTFYGWTKTSGSTQREESLVATGDPMTLYAIFLVTEVTFGYTGVVQSFTAKKGVTYQLKVWGSQGGSVSNPDYASGGLGGYAVGNYTPATDVTLTVNAGCNSNNTGGGSRSGTSVPDSFGRTHTIYQELAAGGAGTSIKNGNTLIICAGGGGGGAAGSDSVDGNTTYSGGTGGGSTGGNGGNGGGDTTTTGGTQTGQGTDAKGGSSGLEASVFGGAGGGYYRGGNGGLMSDRGYYIAGGSGGSGYIGGVTSGSMSNGQRSGHGQAKIVIVSVS